MNKSASCKFLKFATFFTFSNIQTHMLKSEAICQKGIYSKAYCIIWLNWPQSEAVLRYMRLVRVKGV